MRKRGPTPPAFPATRSVKCEHRASWRQASAASSRDDTSSTSPTIRPGGQIASCPVRTAMPSSRNAAGFTATTSTAAA
eukprot:2506148-Alexandrium_andersonii.AAC.1